MQKSVSGMVLLVVLIFLEVFTLLGLYVLQNNVLQQRIVNNAWLKDNLQREAFEALELARQQLDLQIPNCVVPVSDVASQPLSWWQAHACVGKGDGFQYYYVVEMLGEEACAVTDGEAVASFYRVSLLMVAGHGGRVVIQGVMVKAGGDKLVCAGMRRNVKLGWQLIVIPA